MTRTRRTGRGSAGFTLAETLVAVAVSGIIAGVVLTQMVTPTRDADASALAATISGVAGAVHSFRGDVGRYPGELELLNSPKEGGRDSCGRPLPAELLSRWHGPYLRQQVDAGGLKVGELQLRDGIRAEPAARSVEMSGMVFLDIVGVDRRTAEKVEQDFDGDENFAAGSIRWAVDGDSDEGTLSYGIAIRGC